MPHPTTLRDVVPILEELKELTKIPLVAKQDTVLYKRIAEATSRLCSIDIENAIIESHAFGEIGKVQADQTRNYCAEIVTRIETFQNVFYKLDRERKNKSKADMIDSYESNHFLKDVEMFYMIAAHYEYALKACHKIPVPDDWTIDKYKQEIEQFHMVDTREGWLEKKREFLKKLKESVEYDEFLLKPSFDVYMTCEMSVAKYLSWWSDTSHHVRFHYILNAETLLYKRCRFAMVVIWHRNNL